MSQWFSNTGVEVPMIGHLEMPELSEITFSSSTSSDSLISTVLLLLLNIILPPMRKIFLSTFSHIPFSAINTKLKLSNYIREILKPGATCVRKVRLFTIGHQGAGKTSLLHSVRKLKHVTTEENVNLLETKLVDILEDFEIEDNTTFNIVKKKEESSLIFVTEKSLPEIPPAPSVNETPPETMFSWIRLKLGILSEQPKQKAKPNIPNWTVSPFDLGGHSPYFDSQKMFSSPSSFFFLIFSR